MLYLINTFVCVKFLMFLVFTNGINAEVLRCYVCVDCDAVNETHIDTCIKPLPETPTTSGPSTIWTSTQIQETGVTNTDAPTTVVTTQPSTDVTSTYSTTEPPSSTVVSTDATSDSMTTTRDPMSSVTEESFTTDSTFITTVADTEAPSTTVEKLRNAPSLEAPIKMVNMDLPITEVKTTQESDNIATFPKAQISDESKFKEYATSAPTFYNVQMAQAEHRRRRAISSGDQRNSPSETRCVVTKFVENSRTRIKRGCSFTSGDAENRCRELIGETFLGNLIHCSVCDESLCNSASKSAITLIFSSIFLLLIFQI